jgi:hypothetical protein
MQDTVAISLSAPEEGDGCLAKLLRVADIAVNDSVERQ